MAVPPPSKESPGPKLPALRVRTSVDHNCVLNQAGELRCFGQGMYGKLGYGNTNDIGDDEAPASAGIVDVGGRVVEVSAGYMHTCALLTEGRVRCWGWGQNGRLGYGNTDDIGDDEPPARAGDVPLGGRAKSVCAGQWHSCAVLDNGAVRCWGVGRYGRLGYGNVDDVGDDETPAEAGDVVVGGKAARVFCGGQHTCALLDNGALRCWGANFAGQLGYGHTNNVGDDEAPATAGDVPVGGKILDVGLAAIHTCVLIEGGRVRCWGNGDRGRLGTGNTNNLGDQPGELPVADVKLSGTAVALGVGDSHACVVLTSGDLQCFGDNIYGRLGYGHTNNIGDDETPSSVGVVPFAGEKFAAVAAGGAHTCALTTTGALRCFGHGAVGQIGQGNTDDVGNDEPASSIGPVPLFAIPEGFVARPLPPTNLRKKKHDGGKKLKR
ncbi:MAG: hypothetical protein PHU25_20885 [Deltaproteobacteria bacterium]|nr:hypothetical protein [Deltaproteobacteria bacterium]